MNLLKTFSSQLLKKISEYKKIALFVHVNPDFDAYGSAFGMKSWLKNNFQNITVYLMIPRQTFAADEKFLFNSNDSLPEEQDLRDCLGIIFDTSNPQRILTQMHIHCQELMVIDHHPRETSFYQLGFIDQTYPATCQILSEIFFYLEESDNCIFSEEMAQYFYAGIVTDTNNFMSLSMIPSTYEIIAKLVSKGINRNTVHDFIFLKAYSRRIFETEVIKRSKVTENGLIYSVVPYFVFRKYKVKIPNIVNILENISGIEVWTSLFFDRKNKKWKCSIRSKEVTINHIARAYGGGGHKTMSAVLFPTKFSYYRMIATLDEYLASIGFKNVTLPSKKINFVLRLIKFLNWYEKV